MVLKPLQKSENLPKSAFARSICQAQLFAMFVHNTTNVFWARPNRHKWCQRRTYNNVWETAECLDSHRSLPTLVVFIGGCTKLPFWQTTNVVVSSFLACLGVTRLGIVPTSSLAQNKHEKNETDNINWSEFWTNPKLFILTLKFFFSDFAFAAVPSKP